MAKRVDDFFLDAFLASVATCISLDVCTAEPANHAAIAGVSLATVTLTAGDGNGDYTIAAGDVSGRKLTTLQQTDMDITASGDATHVVRSDGTNLVITTCPTQTLTSGGTVTVSAYDHEITDVT